LEQTGYGVQKRQHAFGAAAAEKTIIYQTGSVTRTPLPLSASYLSLKNDTVGICTGKAKKHRGYKSNHRAAKAKNISRNWPGLENWRRR
jgi:hypothetical protein